VIHEEVDQALAATNDALTILDGVIDGGDNDLEQLRTVVAVLAMNLRAQHRVLRALAEQAA
jgi:hypothetical protein